MRFRKLFLLVLLIILFTSTLIVNAEVNEEDLQVVPVSHFNFTELYWPTYSIDYNKNIIKGNFSGVQSLVARTRFFVEEGNSYLFQLPVTTSVLNNSSNISIGLKINNKIVFLRNYDKTNSSSTYIENIYYTADFTGSLDVSIHFGYFDGARSYLGGVDSVQLKSNAVVIPLLDKPSLYLESTLNKISSSWSKVTNADYYEVYLNNTKITETTNTNYVFTGLTHNKEYTVKIVAMNREMNFQPSTVIETIKTKNYFVGYPDDVNSTTGVNWGKVFWSEVESTELYQLRLDDGPVRTTTDLNYLFEGLSPDTEYTVYIRQKSLNGNYSDWTHIKFRTLPPLELPPQIPSSIKLVNRGLDFLEIEVDETLEADGYIFYLFGNEISKQTDRFLRIDNLEPSTNYSISVSAYNKYGNSYKAFNYFMTLGANTPSVISAESKSKRISDENGKETVYPNIQELSWKTKNVNDGVKVLIDGILVGEFDSTTNFSEINLDEIEGLEIKNSYEIEIIPIDEGGVPYKFKFFTNSSGNNSLDLIVDTIKDAISSIGKNGMVLLLALLAFVILFFGMLWLFSKWKLEMSTKTPDMLSDTTLNVNSPILHQKGEGATMIDKQVAKAEKEYERIYMNTLKLNDEQTNKYLKEQKVNDLKQIAKFGSIDGYSQMTKEQLADSITSNRDEISKFIKADLSSAGSPKAENKSKNNKSNKISKNQSFLSYVVENSMKGGGNSSKGSYRKGNSNYKSNRVLQLENQILRLEKENLKLKKGSDIE